MCDIAHQHTVRIDISGREICIPFHAEVIAIFHRKGILTIACNCSLEQFSVHVILADRQTGSSDNHIDLIGIDGIQLIIVCISGISDQSAVISGSQNGGFIDIAVPLFAKFLTGTGIVKIVASAGPVGIKVHIECCFFVGCHHQIILGQDSRIGEIHAIQRKDTIFRDTAYNDFHIICHRDRSLLDQLHRDLRIGIIRNDPDRISGNTGTVQGNGEVQTVIHIKPVIFHSGAIECPQIVIHADIFPDKCVCKVSESDLCLCIDKIFRTVFRKLTDCVQEIAPGTLTDFRSVIIKIRTGSITVEAHRIIGKNRVEHSETGTVSRRRDHGAVDDSMDHCIIQGIDCGKQQVRNTDCRTFDRVQHETQVTVSADIIPVIVCQSKALAKGHPVCPGKAGRRIGKCIQCTAQSAVSNVE